MCVCVYVCVRVHDMYTQVARYSEFVAREFVTLVGADILQCIWPYANTPYAYRWRGTVSSWHT